MVFDDDVARKCRGIGHDDVAAQRTVVGHMHVDQEQVPGAETRLTAPGTMLGTCGYMSPEQIRGDDVDQRTDLFSFGIVLYEMFVGKHPFLRDNAADTISAILRDPAPPAPWLPSGLERVLTRCLAKDRDERWASAGELETGREEAAGRKGPCGALKRWLQRA